jgi:hypothetical protein
LPPQQAFKTKRRGFRFPPFSCGPLLGVGLELARSKQLKKQFFFEKKNQKTFANLRPRCWTVHLKLQKFLLLFSKRSASFKPLFAHPVLRRET